MKVKKSTAYAMHALMYMVRHNTQLPATTDTIAKAEGIPSDYLAKIFQKLAKAGFIKAVSGRNRGYIFDRSPEQISLYDIIEVVEGGPLFNDCLLKHCECGGTPENCRIFSIWTEATKKIKTLLEETTVANATWAHPEHRFLSLSESLADQKNKNE